MNKILFLILGSCLLFFIILGCSQLNDLKDTAKENMDIERSLPKYSLTLGEPIEISYEDTNFIIEETEIDLDNLEEPIGKVSERMTINEVMEVIAEKELKKIHLFPKEDEYRELLQFGWVYEIRGSDPDKEVAININEKFLKATRSDGLKE